MALPTTPAEWPVTYYLNVLRDHRQELAERYHIESLGVFGSYTRNEQQDDSDLDVLVTFTQTPGFFTLVALEDELSDLLGARVDLVLKHSLKPRIGQRILSEVIPV